MCSVDSISMDEFKACCQKHDLPTCNTGKIGQLAFQMGVGRLDGPQTGESSGTDEVEVRPLLYMTWTREGKGGFRSICIMI